MVAAPVFVSRLIKLPLVDSTGLPIGDLHDVVLVSAGRDAPRVLGFVANVQRRRIFVNANRVGDIDPTGVRLRTGTIDVRPFSKRPGEQLVLAEMFGTRVDDSFITDVAIEQNVAKGSWYLTQVALGGRGPLRRRHRIRVVPWSDVAVLFDEGPEYAEVAQLREMHQSDVARRLLARPRDKRQQVAAMLEDERLADLIEELPEDEAIRLIESLDLERAAHVLEEMEPDDAADLLGDLPEYERMELLDAMDRNDSVSLRRLLAYDDDTAGGLMTPEPVILLRTASVAEALAQIRRANTPAELAAQVFVVNPPTSTPTGEFLGSVGFQRLLREAPGTALEHCIDGEPDMVTADLPLREVAERLASYDLLAVAVCDAAGRLIGAVTVDDVLDQVLPEGWRRRVRR